MNDKVVITDVQVSLNQLKKIILEQALRNTLSHINCCVRRTQEAISNEEYARVEYAKAKRDLEAFQGVVTGGAS